IFPTPMPQQPPEVMDFGGYAPGPFLIEGAPDPAPPSAAAHERPAPAREALSAPFADAAPQGAAEPPAAATPPSDAEPPAAATPPSDAEPQSPGALARFEAATTLRPDGRLERPAPAPSPGGGLALAHPGASPEDGAALALAARAPAPSREGDDDRSAARRPADDSQAPRGGRPARRVLAGALVALVAAGLLAGAVALVASRAPSAPAGVLVIDSTPQGASIVLPDGETLGTTPWAGNNPFSVDTRVTLRRPGRRPASLVVPGGTDAHLSVVLDSR
ncbi:MAG: hypothetical protein INH37_16585, partial [Myxococcaceae bacterium]|nr:hypothetical protein [Myxococcaceae bacterium]